MKRKVLLVGFLVASLAATAQAAVTYSIKDSISLVQMSYAFNNLTWDLTGRQIAITVGLDIYAASVLNPQATAINVLTWQGGGHLRWHEPIAWSPKGNFIIFATTKYAQANPAQCSLAKCSATATDAITFDLLKPSDLGYSDETYGIHGASIVSTPVGNLLVCSVIHWKVEDDPPIEAPHTEAIYCLAVDADGKPDPKTSKLLITVGSELLVNPVLSPTANELVVGHPVLANKRELRAFTGLLDVINGQSGPLNASEGRSFYNGEQYAINPQFSQDGSLGFYSVGSFTEGDPPGSADFDIAVVDVNSIFTGVRESSVMVYPGSQGSLACSPGGTRFAYADCIDGTNWRVCVATLQITKDLPVEPQGKANGETVWVVAEDFTLQDGAGTVLSIPAGTVVSGVAPEGGVIPISVSTPITALEEIERESVGGVVVPRTFSPEDLQFTPPVSLQISYTDEEVALAGLDEANLDFVEITGAKGAKGLQGLTVIERNPAENYVIGAVMGFSQFALVFLVDSDDDGLADIQEEELGTDPNNPDTDYDGLSDYREVYWDGDEALNAYDPSTNPTGTDLDPFNPDTDSDGMTDGQEVTFGYDPLDSESFGQLPANSLVGLGLLILALVLVGGIGLRNQASKVH